ncbi:MAG: hypothetical protein RQ760_01975 [Sedimentisphaerales bacterium]|nr:hypothetical protein [Sedimentisphaerales bacterium]
MLNKEMNRSENGVYGVALVVNPDFAEKLSFLAARIEVWICSSPENRASAECIWAKDSELNSRYGVTTFKYSENNSPEQVVLNILPIIDIHYNEYSHEPTWQFLEVYGASVTSDIEVALKGYGDGIFEVTVDGFIFKRELPVPNED